MAHKRDDVFVIKSLDYKEADKILTLFGRKTGRFTVIAKGIRKITSKNRGNMQTLSLASIGYFEGKGMGILRDTELILPFDSTVIAIKVAEKILYLLNKMLVDDQPEPDIFSSLEKLLQGEVNMASLNKFRFAVLSKMGFLPNTNECVYTGDTENLIYFDPKRLGNVSSNAISQNMVSENDLWVRNLLDYGEAKVTEALDNYIKEVVS
jgi:DNA repair protein RecO (recombination protein O)